MGTACDFLELCILNCQILTSYALDNCLIIISVKKKPLPPSSARCKKYAFMSELEKSFLWFQRDRSPVTPGHSQICKGKPRWKVKDAKVRGGAHGRVILSWRRSFSPEGLRNTSRSLQDGSREVIWSELYQVNKTNAVLNQKGQGSYEALIFFLKLSRNYMNSLRWNLVLYGNVNVYHRIVERIK